MQEYIWVAKYKDGSMLMEFEANGTENSFYNIQRDKLSSFGILGGGNSYAFGVKDGVLRLNDKIVDIKYGDVSLTGNGDYSDIITYKDAEAKFSPNGQTSNAITKYNVGYKASIAGLRIRVIYTVDMNGSNYLSVRLVSLVNREGTLTIGGYAVSAPLKADVASEIRLLEEMI